MLSDFEIARVMPRPASIHQIHRTCILCYRTLKLHKFMKKTLYCVIPTTHNIEMHRILCNRKLHEILADSLYSMYQQEH
jgi:hypothetical protein